MSANESIKFSNIAATTSPFVLVGGCYMVNCKATGYGTIKLQVLGPDGVTYLDIKQAFDNAGTEQDDVIGTFAADGSKVLALAPGQYRLTVASCTAIYVTVTRVPLE